MWARMPGFFFSLFEGLPEENPWVEENFGLVGGLGLEYEVGVWMVAYVHSCCASILRAGFQGLVFGDGEGNEVVGL